MRIRSAADWSLPIWPVDKPFPLSPEECLALCRGDLVNPGLTADEALDALPFRFEMVDGWIALKRPD